MIILRSAAASRLCAIICSFTERTHFFKEVNASGPLFPGYDETLREVHRRYNENPDKYFFADQYKNDNNWKAHYHGTANEIIQQTGGDITHFISGVGTGGSITGIGRRLKEYDPDIKIVMVNSESFH